MTVLAIICALIGLGQLVRILACGGGNGGSRFTAGTALRYGWLARLAGKMARR